MIPAGQFVAIYLAFVVKHLLADYILQTPWMVAGKQKSSGWLLPLAAHAGIHAAGTLIIALVFAPSLWWLAAVDLAVHAGIDRTKVALTSGLRLGPSDTGFWWALGADQTLHQLTHFAFALALAIR